MHTRTNIIFSTLLFLPLVVVLFLTTSGFINSLATVVWLLIFSVYYSCVVLWQLTTSVRLEKKYYQLHTDWSEKYRGRTEIEEYNLRKIAGILTGNTGNWMAVSKVHLYMVKLDDKEEAAENIEKSMEILSMACDELDGLTHLMRSETVKGMGLLFAIESAINRVEADKSIETVFEVNGEMSDLDEDTEVVIFRMVQEWIRNILRYAKATTIKVILTCNPDDLEIIIQDDGKWKKERYHYDSPETLLKVATTILAGNFKIVKEEEQLTSLHISIPCKDKVSLLMFKN